MDTRSLTYSNFTELRLSTGTDGASVTVLGQTNPGDGFGGSFYWDDSSTLPDDNVDTIQRIGTVVGRWLRVATQSSGGYIAGDGIDITGDVITNTDPDQIVTIVGTGGATVTGTYPDFTIDVDGADLSNYYTKTELQTSGDAEVHWDNITDVPDFVELSDLSGDDPITFNNTTGVIGITQSDSSTDGYLSSVDWNTFNDKADPFDTGNIVAGSGVNFTGSGSNRLFGSGTLTISVDPIDLSGYVPETRVITINGTSQDLSQDRTWNLTTSVIPEGSNFYFTTTRARNAISGGSGISYDPATGIITNTAQNQEITLTEGDNIIITGSYPDFTIAADLSDYYTIDELGTSGEAEVHWDNITDVPDFIDLADLSASAPIQYNSSTGNFSITQSGASSDGYLSSTDWNTFNDKADAFDTGDLIAGTGVTLTGSGMDRLVGSGNLTINAEPVDLSGYVPTSRTLTINGTTFDLTANRSWTIPVADGSETIITAGTGVTVTGTGTAAIPYIISSPYQTLDWDNSTKTISISDGNSQVLTGLVSTDLSITNSYGINIGGNLTTGLSIGLDTTVVDLRYLRKDVDDSNGSNKLTLGELEVDDETILNGTTTLNSTATGGDNTRFLTLNASNEIEETPITIEDPILDVANAGGTSQFDVNLANEQIRFAGAGDTTVSFNAATNTVTFTSIPGSGGGGAVTSFNGRTGGVVSETGDYNTGQVTETTNLYFTEQRVLDTVLDGYAPIAGTIQATDTVLEAFGKTQQQLNNRVPTARTLTIQGTAGRTVVGGATQDLSANRTWTVDLAEAGTAGTYTKVTTDAYGRVISGTTLETSDIPISAGSGIAISPSGVISNTAQDQTVTITGAGLTNVTGTYPNFTVNTTLIAGPGIDITGNTISATASIPDLQQVTDVGSTTDNTMTVTSVAELTDTEYTASGTFTNIGATGTWSRRHSFVATDGTTPTAAAHFGAYGTGPDLNYGYISTNLSSIHTNADIKFVNGLVGINIAGNAAPLHTLHVNGDVGINSLSGTGVRMVTADAGGVLSTQTIPNMGDYVPNTRTIFAGDGLTGGGDLSTNISISMGTPGSVTASSTNTATSTSHTHELAANAVITAKIANSAVTLAKIQNIPTQTLLGRYSSGTGVSQSITLGTGLALNASGVLSATNTSTGTVTSVSADIDGTALSVNVGTPTTTPDIELSWEGTTSQYVTGAGTLMTFPSVPSNYVTTNTNQTGLTGNKTWESQHDFQDGARVGFGAGYKLTSGNDSGPTYSDVSEAKLPTEFEPRSINYDFAASGNFPSLNSSFNHIETRKFWAGANKAWQFAYPYDVGTAAKISYRSSTTNGSSWGAFRTIATEDWVTTQIPTVNNGTLTLTSSGIATGSGSFTANQAGNTTFTVNVPGTNLGGSLVGDTLTVTSSTGNSATINVAGLTGDDVRKTDTGPALATLTPDVDAMVGGASVLYAGTSSTNLPTGISGVGGGILITGRHASVGQSQLYIARGENDALLYRNQSGVWNRAASRDWVLSQLPTPPTNYVTTNTTQTALAGNKTWEGVHTFNVGRVAIGGGTTPNFSLAKWPSGPSYSDLDEDTTAADIASATSIRSKVFSFTDTGNFPSVTAGYHFVETIIPWTGGTGNWQIAYPYSNGTGTKIRYRNGSGTTWSPFRTFASEEWVISQGYTTNTGTVTSVAATVDGAALNVAGSPITNSGTLAFTWTGNAGQYVNGLGNLTNFPTIPPPYTLPVATATTLGGIELFSNTVQSVAANAVSSTASRTYGIQLNSDGQAVVNVPWTDTNSGGTVTSITIGNGLTGASPITDIGTITLGNPGTITLSSSNTVTASSHTHEFNPGGTAAQYIDGTGNLQTFPGAGGWSDTLGYNYEGNDNLASDGLDTKGGYATRELVFSTNSTTPDNVEHCIFIGTGPTPSTLSLPDPAEYPSRVISIINSGDENLILGLHQVFLNIRATQTLDFLTPASTDASGTICSIRIQSIFNPLISSYIWAIIQYSR